MQIIKHESKIVVKFTSAEPSRATVRRAERLAGCSLNYCGHGDGLIVWNGPSNTRTAGWSRVSRRTLRRTGATERQMEWIDRAGHGRMSDIAKDLQSRYSKLRYSRQWSSRVYEGLFRSRANGITVCNFTAPQLP